MDLKMDMISIEAAITEILNPSFFSINYDLNYGNVQLRVVVGDDKYAGEEKSKGISEILALINLYYPSIIKKYELIVEVYTNDDVLNYINVLEINK